MSVLRARRRWILTLAAAAAASTASACSDTAAPHAPAIAAPTQRPAADIDPSTCRNGWVVINGKVECL